MRISRMLIWGATVGVGPVYAGAADDIREVKPPVALPDTAVFWAVGVGTVLAVALLVLIAWAWLKRRPTTIPPVSPWADALERLAALHPEAVASMAEEKEYYSQLANILRHYLESRFAVKAPEMTTEEFIARLRNDAMLTGEQKELLRRFLQCADMVKFARFASSVSERKSAWEFVQRFIEQTRPLESPVGQGPVGKP